jgi:hypothetical protein
MRVMEGYTTFITPVTFVTFVTSITFVTPVTCYESHVL